MNLSDLPPEQRAELHAYVKSLSPAVRQLVVRFPPGSLLRVAEHMTCADHADLRDVVVVGYGEPIEGAPEGFVSGQPVRVDDDGRVAPVAHERGMWMSGDVTFMKSGPECGTGPLDKQAMAAVLREVEAEEIRDQYPEERTIGGTPREDIDIGEPQDGPSYTVGRYGSTFISDEHGDRIIPPGETDPHARPEDAEGPMFVERDDG